MKNHKAFMLVVLFVGGASVALACGPYFPWQLLDDRTTTLRATPHNSFAFEAAHLVPQPSDHFKVLEPQYPDTMIEPADFGAIEKQGLNPDQIEQLEHVRTRTDSDDTAYADGAGLPVAVRLYTAGAMAFQMKQYEAAARRFDAVLALPPPEQKLRATWAAFMAGRTAALLGDDAKAARMFQRTRSLALAGASDPLGLAVGSYGEEAQLHFNRTLGNQADDWTRFRNELATAAGLYATQAAQGSDSGVQSLRVIAEQTIADPERIEAAASAPILERLLVIYALGRLNDTPAQDYGPNDAGTRETGIKLNPALGPLVDAIVKIGGTNVAGADRLAALCYRTGRYDLAAKLADKASTPLAEWVKAKLALQKGDLDGAASHYAAAAKGFPQTQGSADVDPDNSNRVVGENGVLALARGEYVDALDTLFPVAATYWGDVAYIAEDVLTTDELKTFVDAHPASGRPAPAGVFLGANFDPAERLRYVLARRLMRDSRYAAALDYFDDPKLRAEASRFAADVHVANTDWWPTDRAQASFAAAKLAREDGMEFLGSEVAPDYNVLDGEFDWGFGQDKPKGAYVTGGEKTRAAQSAPLPDLRYHYRYVAADKASFAADLLPRRSQAFASVLCWSDGWMMETPGQDALVRQIYRRYVAQGPRAAWAKHFGRDCPDPDFVSAAAMQRQQIYHATRHYVSRYRWWFAGFALAFASLLTLGILAARRKT